MAQFDQVAERMWWQEKRLPVGLNPAGSCAGVTQSPDSTDNSHGRDCFHRSFQTQLDGSEIEFETRTTL